MKGGMDDLVDGLMNRVEGALEGIDIEGRVEKRMDEWVGG